MNSEQEKYYEDGIRKLEKLVASRAIAYFTSLKEEESKIPQSMRFYSSSNVCLDELKRATLQLKLFKEEYYKEKTA